MFKPGLNRFPCNRTNCIPVRHLVDSASLSGHRLLSMQVCPLLAHLVFLLTLQMPPHALVFLRPRPVTACACLPRHRAFSTLPFAFRCAEDAFWNANDESGALFLLPTPQAPFLEWWPERAFPALGVLLSTGACLPFITWPQLWSPYGFFPSSVRMFPLALRVPLAPRNSCAGTDGSAPPWQLRTCGRPDSLDLFVYPPHLVTTECRRMFSEGPADWSAIVVVGNEGRAEHLDLEARCGAVYW